MSSSSFRIVAEKRELEGYFLDKASRNGFAAVDVHASQDFVFAKKDVVSAGLAEALRRAVEKSAINGTTIGIQKTASAADGHSFTGSSGGASSSGSSGGASSSGSSGAASGGASAPTTAFSRRFR